MARKHSKSQKGKWALYTGGIYLKPDKVFDTRKEAIAAWEKERKKGIQAVIIRE